MRNRLFAVSALLLFAVGCKTSSQQEVVVYTSVDQVFVEPILKGFEEKTGIHVKAVYDTEEAKSTGVFNRLVAESSHPQADVFWSGDPVRAALLKQKDILSDYVSPNSDHIPPRYKDPNGAWTGFSARARVLMFNSKVAKEPPQSYRDLVNPLWKGKVAIANPIFGTTTFHIAGLYNVLGEKKAKEFLESLKKNQAQILPSNGDVKNAVVSGRAALGLVDTDDANEAVHGSKEVSAVLLDQDSVGTLVIPNTLCLIKNSPNSINGKKLIDFLLTDDVENDLAASAAQMPLLGGIKIPANFPANVKTIKDMDVDYNDVAKTLDKIQPYLKEWAGF